MNSLDSFYDKAPEPKNLIAWQESLDDYAQEFNTYTDSLLEAGLEEIDNLFSVIDIPLSSRLNLNYIMRVSIQELQILNIRVPNLYERYEKRSFYNYLRKIIDKNIDNEDDNERYEWPQIRLS